MMVRCVRAMIIGVNTMGDFTRHANARAGRPLAEIGATVLPLFLCLVFAVALFGGDAHADKLRKQCDAVRQLAEIELDSTLILNIAGDTDTNTCVFYVSLPPTGAHPSAASKAAGTFQRLFFGDDATAAVASLETEFIPEALNALLMPLSDPRFQTSDAKLLEAAIRERSKLIRECSAEVLTNKMQFQAMDDVISCGLSETNSTLVVQASFREVSLALLIPLA